MRACTATAVRAKTTRFTGSCPCYGKASRALVTTYITRRPIALPITAHEPQVSWALHFEELVTVSKKWTKRVQLNLEKRKKLHGEVASAQLR